MKKNYICPTIEAIKLKANQTLLAGSLEYNRSTDSYRGGFLDGDYSSETDEKILGTAY